MRRQVNRNRQRNPLSAQQLYKVFQPKPKIVTFFDIFTFGVIAATIFFNSLTPRSILFNVAVSVALLIKVFIGVYFYKKNNARSLRQYFMLRYLYNILIIYPLIAVLKFFTGTYVLNNFLAGGMLAGFELIITGIYLKHLLIKAPIENIEDIPGYIIKSKTEDLQVLNIKANRAAEYLSKSYRKQSILNIIKNKQQQQDKQKLIKVTGRPMTPFELLQKRQEDQHRHRVGFNLIRPEDEIEAEIQFEEVFKNKKANSSKFMSFEFINSRDVVNDVKIMDQKEKQKIQYIQDARDDIEREKEKFRKAMDKMKGGNKDQQQEEQNKQKDQREEDGPIVYTDQVKMNQKDEDNILITNEEDVEQQSDRDIVNRSNINDTAAKSTSEKQRSISKIMEINQIQSELRKQTNDIQAKQQINQSDKTLNQQYQSNRQTSQNLISEEQIPQRNSKSQQRQSQKQKFKSYEEKFEIQRLQIQKQQQKQVQQSHNQKSFGYSNSNVRKNIDLQNNQQNRRNKKYDDYDSEYDSESYDSETSDRRRRRNRQQSNKNNQKKIHGVNDGGDSSSSLSEDENKNKNRKSNNQQQSYDRKTHQSNKSNNQKQVRFDENKNTFKDASDFKQKNGALNKNNKQQSYDTEGDSD